MRSLASFNALFFAPYHRPLRRPPPLRCAWRRLRAKAQLVLGGSLDGTGFFPWCTDLTGCLTAPLRRGGRRDRDSEAAAYSLKSAYWAETMRRASAVATAAAASLSGNADDLARAQRFMLFATNACDSRGTTPPASAGK